jgi:hypothetical protein
VASDDADSSTDCGVDAPAGTPVATPEAEEPDDSPVATPETDEQIRICHVTSSDEYPYILIEVGADELSEHEDHGDFVAPDDADSSNDCEDAAPPVASPVASPEAEVIG